MEPASNFYMTDEYGAGGSEAAALKVGDSVPIIFDPLAGRPLRNASFVFLRLNDINFQC